MTTEYKRDSHGQVRGPRPWVTYYTPYWGSHTQDPFKVLEVVATWGNRKTKDHWANICRQRVREEYQTGCGDEDDGNTTRHGGAS